MPDGKSCWQCDGPLAEPELGWRGDDEARFCSERCALDALLDQDLPMSEALVLRGRELERKS